MNVHRQCTPNMVEILHVYVFFTICVLVIFLVSMMGLWQSLVIAIYFSTRTYSLSADLPERDANKNAFTNKIVQLG